MSTITHDGFWPLIEPKAKSAGVKKKKSLMDRFVEAQERRARVRIAHILGGYNTGYLRQIGLSNIEIRKLVGSRDATTR